MTVLLIFLAWALAGQAALPELLQKAGQYAIGFEQGFSTVIGDETTVQREYTTRNDRGRTRTSESSRTVQSETMFMWLAEERGWLTVRNVRAVDKRPVGDSHERLDRIVADTAPDAIVSRFQRLREESARFNIGGIRRTFADPMLPFQFLDPKHQPRFTFALDGEERVDQVAAWRVTFSEVSEPSLIAVDGRSSPASGVFWITASGIVLRTRLLLGNNRTNLSAVLVVDYAHDRKIGGWVPARMEEIYSQAPPAAFAVNAITTQVICASTYANLRRFETGGRLLAK